MTDPEFLPPVEHLRTLLSSQSIPLGGGAVTSSSFKARRDD